MSKNSQNFPMLSLFCMSMYINSLFNYLCDRFYLSKDRDIFYNDLVFYFDSQNINGQFCINMNQSNTLRHYNLPQPIRRGRRISAPPVHHKPPISQTTGQGLIAGKRIYLVFILLFPAPGTLSSSAEWTLRIAVSWPYRRPTLFICHGGILLPILTKCFQPLLQTSAEEHY